VFDIPEIISGEASLGNVCYASNLPSSLKDRSAARRGGVAETIGSLIEEHLRRQNRMPCRLMSFHVIVEILPDKHDLRAHENAHVCIISKIARSPK